MLVSLSLSTCFPFVPVPVSDAASLSLISFSLSHFSSSHVDFVLSHFVYGTSPRLALSPHSSARGSLLSPSLSHLRSCLLFHSNLQWKDDALAPNPFIWRITKVWLDIRVEGGKGEEEEERERRRADPKVSQHFHPVW